MIPKPCASDALARHGARPQLSGYSTRTESAAYTSKFIQTRSYIYSALYSVSTVEPIYGFKLLRSGAAVAAVMLFRGTAPPSGPT